uniref:Uncharacterized protein n=1 Tax=Amphimedon queenslandica TaxID=400682 RepID=A0A1X7U055_AMPQE
MLLILPIILFSDSFMYCPLFFSNMPIILLLFINIK